MAVFKDRQNHFNRRGSSLLPGSQAWRKEGVSQFLRSCEPRQKAPNSKLQAPKKHQVPNTKLQTPEKLQARSTGRGLELGAWDFFGVWSLVFGVSIAGFLWSLGFGAWCFAQRRLRSRDAPEEGWLGIRALVTATDGSSGSFAGPVTQQLGQIGDRGAPGGTDVITAGGDAAQNTHRVVKTE